MLSEGAKRRIGSFLSGEAWKRRFALWGGALAVAFAAIAFAKLGDAASHLFASALTFSPYWALAITPAVFALLAWLTRGGLKGTRGSGIPQVIAVVQSRDHAPRNSWLSFKVVASKLLLTVAALAGGASVGREGPTVHIGAGIMHAIGRIMGYRDPYQTSRFLLAGGAAGIAAAFNTPLAGVVFAIEELSGTFEHHFSGVLLTAVIAAGVVSLGLMGNYAYFGHANVALAFGSGWWAIALCGVVCGLLGGAFARLIVAAGAGRPQWLFKHRMRSPVLFAAACGLALALLGLWLGKGMFGTGYEQARELLQADRPDGGWFGAGKLAANLVSSLAGIPGGLFAPALAVGAGIGDNLSQLVPSAPHQAVILLGMCGYLAGLTQAPLTSAVICMEMTDNRELMLPVLATVLLARACSALVCHTPIYKALAAQLVEANKAHARQESPP
ncbi:chloride channel protein [Lysobacter enzymogenes]|uniref:Chloride channel n=1 Tax=Lysobacter enzymogenes TaxID=69 RepID=A0AAU9ACF9_LYSEN|nr:chloride channel protein [Lysobacter enzymogenes]BAV95762.1 chloride channel [Lysobacter enzymogenes]